MLHCKQILSILSISVVALAVNAGPLLHKLEKSTCSSGLSDTQLSDCQLFVAAEEYAHTTYKANHNAAYKHDMEYCKEAVKALNTGVAHQEAEDTCRKFANGPADAPGVQTQLRANMDGAVPPTAAPAANSVE